MIKFLSSMMFIVGVGCSTVNAQPAINGNANASDNQIFLKLGLEPEVITTIGYARCVKSFDAVTHFYLGSSIKFAPLIISNKAWRWNVSPSVVRKLSNAWTGMGNMDLYLANNSDRAGSMKALGYEVKGMIVTKNKRWNKGVELSWQHAPLAKVTHGQAARDAFGDRYGGGTGRFNSPVDGWYRGTAKRLKFGFIFSRKLGDATVLQINAGTHFSLQKQKIAFGFPYAQVPLYLHTQLSYQWKQHTVD